MNTKYILPIIPIRQPEMSAECGIACSSMIANYYQMQLDYDAIKASIGLYKWGTTTPQLGLFFLENGYDVEIIGCHPALFYKDSVFDSTDDMLQHLKNMRQILKDDTDKIALEHFINYIKAGGTMQIRIPTAADIDTAIALNTPVLVPVSHWFMHKNDMPPRYSIHFNVVYGSDNECFYVCDPDFGEPFYGQHRIDKQTFMYACYVSCKGGIDDGCVMIVRRK